MWLVITAHDAVFSTKALEKKFGCKNGDLRGATPEVLEEVLGVKGGSVCLFSMMNDKQAKKVQLVIDATLLNDHDWVGFHPMQNDHTTAISKQDVKKIIELSECQCEVLDLTTLEQSAAPVGQPAAKVEKKAQPKAQKIEKKEEGKISGVHELGIEYTKESNFSKWYS